MEQLQKANLVLKGIDSVNNEANTVMTWNNINLRMLLGDMYDKYDNFNLVLNSMGCDDDRLYNSGTNTYTNTAGSDESDRIVTVNVSGLNWLNATYDSATNNMSSSTTIATYRFYETFSKDYHNSIATFTKYGSDRCNITIDLKTIVLDELPDTIVPENAFPYMTFLFSIYGIPREKNV
jgi:hypothetical protein